MSELTSTYLAAYLGAYEDPLIEPSDKPRHIPFAALGNSGYSDTGRRIREILREEWGRAIDR